MDGWVPKAGSLPPADGAFERFLTAAIAAIITIMFSWRLLDDLNEGDRSATEAERRERRAAVVAALTAANPSASGERQITELPIDDGEETSDAEVDKSRAERQAKVKDDAGSPQSDSGYYSMVASISSVDSQDCTSVDWLKNFTTGPPARLSPGFDASELAQGRACDNTNSATDMDALRRRGTSDDRRDMSGGVGELLEDGTTCFKWPSGPEVDVCNMSDDMPPRELDSDEELYCCSLLEPIIEEDSDDFLSSSDDHDSLKQTHPHFHRRAQLHPQSPAPYRPFPEELSILVNKAVMPRDLAHPSPLEVVNDVFSTASPLIPEMADNSSPLSQEAEDSESDESVQTVVHRSGVCSSQNSSSNSSPLYGQRFFQPSGETPPLQTALPRDRYGCNSVLNDVDSHRMMAYSENMQDLLSRVFEENRPELGLMVDSSKPDFDRSGARIGSVSGEQRDGCLLEQADSDSNEQERSNSEQEWSNSEQEMSNSEQDSSDEQDDSSEEQEEGNNAEEDSDNKLQTTALDHELPASLKSTHLPEAECGVSHTKLIDSAFDSLPYADEADDNGFSTSIATQAPTLFVIDKDMPSTNITQVPTLFVKDKDVPSTNATQVSTLFVMDKDMKSTMAAQAPTLFVMDKDISSTTATQVPTLFVMNKDVQSTTATQAPILFVKDEDTYNTSDAQAPALVVMDKNMDSTTTTQAPTLLVKDKDTDSIASQNSTEGESDEQEINSTTALSSTDLVADGSGSSQKVASAIDSFLTEFDDEPFARIGRRDRCARPDDNTDSPRMQLDKKQERRSESNNQTPASVIRDDESPANVVSNNGIPASVKADPELAETETDEESSSGSPSDVSDSAADNEVADSVAKQHVPQILTEFEEESFSRKKEDCVRHSFPMETDLDELFVNEHKTPPVPEAKDERCDKHTEVIDMQDSFIGELEEEPFARRPRGNSADRSALKSNSELEASKSRSDADCHSDEISDSESDGSVENKPQSDGRIENKSDGSIENKSDGSIENKSGGSIEDKSESDGSIENKSESDESIEDNSESDGSIENKSDGSIEDKSESDGSAQNKSGANSVDSFLIELEEEPFARRLGRHRSPDLAKQMKNLRPALPPPPLPPAPPGVKRATTDMLESPTVFKPLSAVSPPTDVVIQTAAVPESPTVSLPLSSPQSNVWKTGSTPDVKRNSLTLQESPTISMPVVLQKGPKTMLSIDRPLTIRTTRKEVSPFADAAVSSATEEMPRGFTFARCESETTRRERRIFLVDKPLAADFESLINSVPFTSESLDDMEDNLSVFTDDYSAFVNDLKRPITSETEHLQIMTASPLDKGCILSGNLASPAAEVFDFSQAHSRFPAVSSVSQNIYENDLDWTEDRSSSQAERDENDLDWTEDRSSSQAEREESAKAEADRGDILDTSFDIDSTAVREKMDADFAFLQAGQTLRSPIQAVGEERRQDTIESDHGSVKGENVQALFDMKGDESDKKLDRSSERRKKRRRRRRKDSSDRREDRKRRRSESYRSDDESYRSDDEGDRSDDSMETPHSESEEGNTGMSEEIKVTSSAGSRLHDDQLPENASSDGARDLVDSGTLTLEQAPEIINKTEKTDSQAPMSAKLVEGAPLLFFQPMALPLQGVTQVPRQPLQTQLHQAVHMDWIEDIPAKSSTSDPERSVEENERMEDRGDDSFDDGEDASGEEEASYELREAASCEEDVSEELREAASCEEDVSEELREATSCEEVESEELREAASCEEDVSDELREATSCEEASEEMRDDNDSGKEDFKENRSEDKIETVQNADPGLNEDKFVSVQRTDPDLSKDMVVTVQDADLGLNDYKFLTVQGKDEIVTRESADPGLQTDHTEACLQPPTPKPRRLSKPTPVPRSKSVGDIVDSQEVVVDNDDVFQRQESSGDSDSDSHPSIKDDEGEENRLLQKTKAQVISSEKRPRSLKEIRRMQKSNVRPLIAPFTLPDHIILPSRLKIIASRKQFLSSENIDSTGFDTLQEQFAVHKLTQQQAKERRYKSPNKRARSTYSSQDQLEKLNYMLNYSRHSESSFDRSLVDHLHEGCILTPEGRRDILNKTLSIENLHIDLPHHLRRFGSVTSLVETDIDTGETLETNFFPETNLDIFDCLFQQHEPLQRSASMSDMMFASSSRIPEHDHDGSGSGFSMALPSQTHKSTGKGRFTYHRKYQKSKSLCTLETNLDDVGEDGGGDNMKRVPSVHELRVSKSLQKLNVPDWFKQSSLSKSSSCLLKYGSSSTMNSFFSPSLISSPCASTAPAAPNVVIRTRVVPPSNPRLIRSPGLSAAPSGDKKTPTLPVKLPSERLREKEKNKNLMPIPIVPFAQIRALFEKKEQREQPGDRDRRESVEEAMKSERTGGVQRGAEGPKVTAVPSISISSTDHKASCEQAPPVKRTFFEVGPGRTTCAVTDSKQVTTPTPLPPAQPQSVSLLRDTNGVSDDEDGSQVSPDIHNVSSRSVSPRTEDAVEHVDRFPAKVERPLSPAADSGESKSGTDSKHSLSKDADKDSKKDALKSPTKDSKQQFSPSRSLRQFFGISKDKSTDRKSDGGGSLDSSFSSGDGVYEKEPRRLGGSEMSKRFDSQHKSTASSASSVIDRRTSDMGARSDLDSSFSSAEGMSSGTTENVPVRGSRTPSQSSATFPASAVSRPPHYSLDHHEPRVEHRFIHHDFTSETAEPLATPSYSRPEMTDLPKFQRRLPGAGTTFGRLPSTENGDHTPKSVATIPSPEPTALTAKKSLKETTV